MFEVWKFEQKQGLYIAVIFVSGQYGGIRAAMQLRSYLSDLGMVHIPSLLGRLGLCVAKLPFARTNYDITMCLISHPKSGGEYFP